jgi:hypothetical protein
MSVPSALNRDQRHALSWGKSFIIFGKEELIHGIQNLKKKKDKKKTFKL